MITEKNHKLLTSQLFVTDCTKKGLASMVLVAVTNEILKRESSKCILDPPRVEGRGARIVTLG
jgi:hypothetical protein